MAFIGVGAIAQNGSLVQTKAALKAQIDTVEFYSTSPFVSFCGGWKALENEAPTTKLSVVGPDPERNRKWYATVEVKDGKVKVS